MAIRILWTGTSCYQCHVPTCGKGLRCTSLHRPSLACITHHLLPRYAQHHPPLCCLQDSQALFKTRMYSCDDAALGIRLRDCWKRPFGVQIQLFYTLDQFLGLSVSDRKAVRLPRHFLDEDLGNYVSCLLFGIRVTCVRVQTLPIRSVAPDH
jgi:hypothetical protein